MKTTKIKIFSILVAGFAFSITGCTALNNFLADDQTPQLITAGFEKKEATTAKLKSYIADYPAMQISSVKNSSPEIISYIPIQQKTQS